MNLLPLLALFLPFQFALNLASAFDVSVLRVIILFFFAGVTLKSLYKKNFFIPLNLQPVCLSAFFLINVFSLFFAQNLEFGLRKILFLASIFPFYYIVYYFIWLSGCCPHESGDPDPNKTWIPACAGMTRWFILGGFLSSIIALIIFFSQFIVGIDGILDFYRKIGPFFWGKSFSQSVLEYQSFLVNIGGTDFARVAGIFPDPHNFALFAGIAMFLALPFIKSYFYGFAFLLSGATLLLSFSRGAYIAIMGASIFLLIIRYFFGRHCEERSNLWIPASAGITKWVVGMTILSIIFFLPPIKNRFLDTFSLEDGSNAGRIQIIKDGLDIFKNNYLFGVGIGNAPLYYSEDIDYRNPTNSHNTYLEIAIESGIGGLVVWLILIFGTVLQLIKSLKFQENKFLQYLSIGLIGGLAFFSIHSLFEVFLYSPINLAAVMILLALSSKIAESPAKT